MTISRLTKHSAGFLCVLFLLAGGIIASCAPSFQSDFAGDDIVQRLEMHVKLGAQDVTLSYLSAGDPSGRQVIFVHGTPGDATAWLDYLHRTVPGRQYIALDRPGFGNTQPERAFTSLTDQAAAVHALLENRAAGRPILVGHSMGGPIIAKVAALYPDAVGGMIQVAGSLDPDLEEIKVIQYLGELPPFVWLIPKALKHTNREIFALESELRALEPYLATITAPTIIIHGTADDLVPYANVAYMQARFSAIRALETVTLDGQNHFLPWNSAPIIDAALARLMQNDSDIGTTDP